jgi:hypothetical protein
MGRLVYLHPLWVSKRYIERVTLFCTLGFWRHAKYRAVLQSIRKKLGYNFNATEGIEPSITRPGSLDVFCRVTLHVDDQIGQMYFGFLALLS